MRFNFVRLALLPCAGPVEMLRYPKTKRQTGSWSWWRRAAVAVSLSGMMGLLGCSKFSSDVRQSPPATPPATTAPTPSPDPTVISSATAAPTQQLLQQSWTAYRQRFIQADGRVIDREAGDRSTSEGQAYAMLRAVLSDDPSTFAKTLQWSENNLQRQANGKRTDQLWVWKWGRNEQGPNEPARWGAIDPNFASDADVDAITALILASRRWQKPEYLKLAQAKLQDLWRFSTVVAGGQRYLLPGPAAAFQQQTVIQLNPSYFAPYAFRLFAQVDPKHDWLSLVDSSYQALENSATLSAVGLPSDWVAVDTTTGEFQPLPLSGPLKSQYSFDAYRVWWRVAWDAELFDSAPAKAYLQKHLGFLQKQWRSQQKIPATFDLSGAPTVSYEATAQYAMLYPAWRLLDPAIATELWQRKLQPQYRNGFWDNNSAYYVQNLAWLGLLPPDTISPQLLQPR
ncbi:glycosyl hydrolase family 8 [Trichocoleus desertorum]|uniref:Glycosyl hydrolase family 8 n=2 Tax=Trichocoleus TaxID=450526 RepID=A0ABV0J3Z2_9CYAN